MATLNNCPDDLYCATLSGSDNVNVNFVSGTPNKIVVSLSQSVVGLSKLEVTGNAIISDNSSNAALRITQTGVGEAIRVEDSTNPDSTPFVVRFDGNVGIGTTAPSEKLEVANTTGFSTIRVTANTSLNTNDEASVRLYSGLSSHTRLFHRENATNFGIYHSNSVGAATKFRINDNGMSLMEGGGNVGIGTTSPQVALDISGSSAAVRVKETNVDARISALGGAANVGIVGTYSNHGLVMFTNSTEKVRIDTAGNVGIGTSAATGIKLHVASDANNWIRSQAANGIPLFNTNRSNGTNASPTNVVNGDELGRFDVRGYNNSDFRQAAQISAVCSATPGGSDTAIATTLYFKTSPGGVTAPQDRMLIDSSGQVGIGITPSTKLHVNGAITADSITFGSAGGTGTATSNTLGDYEEGTWTPNFTFNGGVTGMTKTSSGKYIKIGNLVCVSGIITLSAKGTSTGRARIQNLPFTSTTTERGILQLSETSNFNSVLNYPSLQIAASTTTAEFYIFDTVGTLTEANFNDNTLFRFSGCYLTM